MEGKFFQHFSMLRYCSSPLEVLDFHRRVASTRILSPRTSSLDVTEHMRTLLAVVQTDLGAEGAQ